jgi:hypothetical protein
MAGRILLDQVLPSVSTQHIKTEPLPELEPSLTTASAFFETVRGRNPIRPNRLLFQQRDFGRVFSQRRLRIFRLLVPGSCWQALFPG